MDTTGLHSMREAEHQSRAAAEAAGVQYYEHPHLHMHTYSHHTNGPPIEGPAADAHGAGGVAPGGAVFGTGAPDAAPLDVNGDHGLQKPPRPAALAPVGGAESVADTSAPPTPVTATSRPPSSSASSSHREANDTHTTTAIDNPFEGSEWAVAQSFEPSINVLCGPLLSYYTVVNDVWYGAVMVVTADQNSNYAPTPTLALNFQPYGSNAQLTLQPTVAQAEKFFTFVDSYHSEDKDPKRPSLPGPYGHSPVVGSASFWRFRLAIPVQDVEVAVQYRLNNSAPLQFIMPARGQNLRWTSHSCNGLSLGVEESEFRTDKFKSGFDPLWMDMLQKHQETPFHCMVGGGDQIYCDLVSHEPALQGWLHEQNKATKRDLPLTPDIEHAVDHFYFQHYCKMFGRNSAGFSQANSTIPMVNMLDDHDLIDGFGTYDDKTMRGPIFSYIGSRGYFWYLVFQLFTVDSLDGTDHALGDHAIKSMFFGGQGAYIPFKAHSLSVYLGPNVHMIALDCRAERTYHQIVSKESYEGMFYVISQLPKTVEQLVLLLGVPIAYPRMSFLEHFLGFKYNPAIILAKHNALGLGSLVNKFDKEPELLDDLNDHWCANVHKKERNWFILAMQDIAHRQRLRVSFLSGDVHLTAVGRLFSYKPALEPDQDYRYMLNVITSAIVNTPPPGPVAWLVNKLSGHKHRTLHKHHTDEDVVPLFEQDTDGSKPKRPYALARRNYTAVKYQGGALAFDIRVEKSKGAGETVGYVVVAPPPRWQPTQPANT